MKDAYRILNKDSIMRRVIKATGTLNAPKAMDPYRALLSSIISQQLSTKAADTIHNRFLELYPRRNPKPQLVIDTDTTLIRNAGLSNAKSSYVKNVAEFALQSKLRRPLLSKMSDTELVEHLITIKGVGKWTAEMIAMFSMERDDIFPSDDLGIRNAIGELYFINPNSKTFNKKAINLSMAWSPFRTLACRHLWRWKDQ